MATIKGVDIAWENFQSFVGYQDPAQVINQTSGIINRGTFTTILGPSGAGKTTFLNFLSNRLHYLKGLEFTGQVYINGRKRETLDYNSVASYVMQEDILIEHLKVRETLEFSASFKMSKPQVQERVDDVIKQLGLKSCENSFVGGFLKKGISGGEKKRVSIGVELLTDPSILFLDEPTTGLDSYNSEILIQLLNELSKTGVTVIATIHQPNSYIFALFDRMMLIGGNEIVYHGGAMESLSYFQNIGFDCPMFSNPAEFLLELITVGDENYDANIQKLVEAIEKPPFEVQEKELPHLFHRVPADFFKETRILLKRSSLSTFRNFSAFITKFTANACFLLLTLATYYNTCSGTSMTSITNRAGIIFVGLMYISFLVANTTISLSTDKPLFIREQASKTYNPFAFYLSKMLFEIPFDQIITIFMSFLVYLIVGLSLEYSYQIFFFTFVLLILDFAARGYGNFLLISLPYAELASAASPFLFITQLLFSGLFINFNTIPNYLIWLEYSSMFKYAWSAVMISEFEHRSENYWDGCSDPASWTEKCDPISFYSIDISKWNNVLALSCIAIITHLGAVAWLYLLARKYRVN